MNQPRTGPTDRRLLFVRRVGFRWPLLCLFAFFACGGVTFADTPVGSIAATSDAANNASTIARNVLRAEADRIAAVDKAMPSAVSVFVPGGAGGGSGVLISPQGFALTNFHVSSPAGEFMRCGLSDGRIYDAVIVGIDPVGDLAMIKLLGRDDFPVAEFGNSLAAQPGDWCMAIGNPFLLATNLQPTVTWGILSGVGRYQYPSGTLLEYGDCLQTDASINPGNSGGPLYDAKGRLLGIIGRCSFEKRGRVNVGVGYAISARQAQNFLGYLLSGRIVDHATLGATVATDPEDGVLVTNILTSSDAYRRGLRYGSEILEIDGRPVLTANDVQNVLATLPANWRVKLSFRDDGRTIDTLVRLSSVHQEDELLVKMSAALPPPPPRAPNKPGPEPTPNEPAPKKTPGQPPAGPDGNDADEAQKEIPAEQEDGADGPAVDDTIPPAVQKLITRRRGYANYHFNQIETGRIVENLRAAAVGLTAGEWIVEGTTEEPRPRDVKMRISDETLTLRIDDETIEIKTADDRLSVIERRGVGGLAIALDAWRKMIRDGADKFGETYYLGTMPLGGERPLRDCLIGLRDATETRWLTHPSDRRVEAIEVFADRDSDPAELWLTGHGPENNTMPDVLELRYGVDSFLKVNVRSWQSQESP